MDIGFETVGNATLICHDRGPVLVTDPWITGDAYFGSWTLSHEIPEEQRESIRRCPFVWISHGHPDHLSAASLDQLGGATVLLPDHAGGRIAAALRRSGRDVTVLPDRRWTPLSDRIRVCSIPDYNQDAVLLVDVDGTLVADVNDASDHGWRGFVRRTMRTYDRSFLLRLSGWGDGDMINLFEPDGTRIQPWAARREPVGHWLSVYAAELSARYVVPFSSMHRYQRADSVWANEFGTHLGDYAIGFDSETSELLPAYIRYDVARDEVSTLAPPEREIVPRDPADFGDDWHEPFDDDDRALITSYFREIAHLGRKFGFVAFRVGGEEHVVDLGGPRGRGLTFDVPRRSLMTAIRHRVFDDLLIGNFMRTTVHGHPRHDALYPDFTPYVTKYADNGGARSEAELAHYFAEYRRRAPVDYLRHRVEARSRHVVREALRPGSPVHGAARRVWYAALAARHHAAPTGS